MAASALVIATVAAAVLARRRPIGFPAALAAAAIASGFAIATIKRTLIAHPVLTATAWYVEVSGFVEVHEERGAQRRLAHAPARAIRNRT